MEARLISGDILKEDFYTQFSQTLNKKYGVSSKAEDFQYLVSPHLVTLPTSVLNQAQQIISTFYKVSRTDKYFDQLIPSTGKDNKNLAAAQLNNASVLMAYDFHYDPNTKSLKLIEINTNASAYLLGENLYDLLDGEKTYLNMLKQSFHSETIDLEHVNCAILDEQIEQQKMNFEFHLYNSLFKSMGWNSEIIDVDHANYDNDQLTSSNGEKVNFIYNRFCDFTLDEERSSLLRKSFLSQSCIFSPNPREYILLADKQRLIELSKKETIESLDLSADQKGILKKCLLKSFDATAMEKDQLWAARKTYFFKPKNSFGGKSTYRGKSITKSTFEMMFNKNTTVQEYCPPHTVEFDGEEFKYDLRFYSYRDHMQMPIARLYTGQVTNFKNPNGGISRVIFNN